MHATKDEKSSDNPEFLKGEKTTLVLGSGGIATGSDSVVIGGAYRPQDNEVILPSKAKGTYSAVVGGAMSEATGRLSSVMSGAQCVAEGDNCLCIGGFKNKISGNWSSIIGGKENIIEGANATIISSSSCAVEQGFNDSSIAISSSNCTISQPRVIILGSRDSKIEHQNTIVIGGDSHPCFSTIPETNHIVSILGFEEEDQNRSSFAILQEQNDNAARTYIHGVGGWNGSEEGLKESDDVASVITSMQERIEVLESQLSELIEKINSEEEDAVADETDNENKEEDDSDPVEKIEDEIA